jgi:toxin FitB
MAFFAGDDSATAFSKPIEKLDTLIVPSITIMEVFKCVFCQCGEDMVLECSAHMAQGKVVPLDAPLAIAATKKYDGLVWAQDSDVESLQGVKYFAKNKSA